MPFDTVDWFYRRRFWENSCMLDGRELDHLLVNHSEFDIAVIISRSILPVRHPGR